MPLHDVFVQVAFLWLNFACVQTEDLPMEQLHALHPPFHYLLAAEERVPG